MAGILSVNCRTDSLSENRMTVQLASVPFPSQELRTLAPRMSFHIKDMYKTRGEWSSLSLGGKNEKNIFFCWLGVETGLRACLSHLKNQEGRRTTTSDPHTYFTLVATWTSDFLCTCSILSFSRERMLRFVPAVPVDVLVALAVTVLWSMERPCHESPLRVHLLFA